MVVGLAEFGTRWSCVRDASKIAGVAVDVEDVFGEAAVGEAFVVGGAGGDGDHLVDVGGEGRGDAGDGCGVETDTGRDDSVLEEPQRGWVRAGFDDAVGKGGGDAFFGEELVKGGLGGVLLVAGFGEGAVEDGEFGVEGGLELFGLPPDEVGEADFEDVGGVGGFEGEVDCDGFEGTVEGNLNVFKCSGVDEFLRGGLEAVLREGLAGMESGDGLKVGGGVGSSVFEVDGFGGVLREGCGGEEAEEG